MELSRKIKLQSELEGLLPHLAEMSGNEVKLCLLLHLRGGSVEEAFDGLGRLCGWSLSTLKRTIRELKAKSRIEVERSQVKSDPIAAPASVRSDPQVKSDLIKISHEVKSDPGQVPDVPPGVNDDPIEEAAARIAGLAEGLEIPEGYLAGELPAVCRQALEFIGFACDRKYISRGFAVLLEKYAKRRPWPRAGILACKLIERCLHWQRKRRAEGKDPNLYRWPPGFQKRTANLRHNERESGRQERAAARAAA